MHSKYAMMLNVVFMTFMYGISVPLLFPLACAFFLISYCVETVSLAYFFRKPPMYDDFLHTKALEILKYAPLLMVIFGFWAVGNRQIFDNFVQGRENKNDPAITGHKTLSIDFDQRLPLLLLGLFYFYI